MKLRLKQMTVGLLVQYKHSIKMSDKERFELMKFFGLSKEQFVQLLRKNCENWTKYSMHDAGKYSKYLIVPIFIHWWMIMHAQYDKLFLDMIKENEWIREMDIKEVFEVYCEFHVRWTLPPTSEEIQMMEKQLKQIDELARTQVKDETVFSSN